MPKSEERKEYLRNRREKVCESCGGPKEIGGYCKKCWIKRTARRSKLNQEKKARNECLTCTNPRYKKHTKCHVCLEKYRVQCQKRREARVAAGQCVTCGADNASSNYCSLCFVKNVSKFHFGTRNRYPELIKLLEDQNGVCPYTGRSLEIGVNATLDHKTPKSRGGSDELKNLQWVFCSEFQNVNTLKWNMTDEEFKGLVKLVYEHTVGENGS